jgi:hypothetical protein
MLRSLVKHHVDTLLLVGFTVIMAAVYIATIIGPLIVEIIGVGFAVVQDIRRTLQR